MKKILIVDDQSFIRTVLKGQLEKIEDLAVVEAANGNEAMGKAKVSKPDLILLDIVMPRKDGLQVLEDLKSNPSTQNIPVIVVSSHSEKEKMDKAMELGAKKFIDKANMNTIDFAELVKQYI